MTGIEGVGEAVTGGIAARAVEPAHGEAGEGGGACLNCGAALTGPYCHQCGQKAHVHRTLAGFWHDLVHSVFHFDGKIWRTLPLLAWRPGELTRRYVDGERASFVSPIALFLFSVFLMFAVFSLIGGPLSFDPTGATSPEARAEAEREFRQEQAADRAELARLRTERQRLAQARQPTAAVDGEIRAIERGLEVRERLFRQTLELVAPEGRGGTPAGKSARPAAGAPAAPATTDAEGREALDLSGVSVDSGWPAFDRAANKAARNPQLLAYKLQNNAYKFSWALIPISVPFLWLLFLHRRRYRQYKAYDHMVFVTYSIAFMSLGLIALSLLRPIGLPEGIIGMIIAFVPPIHVYRQLRGAYGLSRWSAIWRTFVLLVFATLALILFFLLLLGIGVLG